MDTSSRTSNTQVDHANVIFTIEELNKSDELVDAVKKLKINNTKYYESNTATARYAQGHLTRNPEAITHAINGNEIATHTSSGYFEQKLLSSQTIPVVVPMMNPRIEQRIEPIILVPQILLKPETKEVVSNAALGGVWVNRTPR